MKKTGWKLLCVSFALMLILGCLPASGQAATGDEIRTAKRVISVVCDDSGSMKGDKWTYANYASQTMISQLNEQDEIYITYMSKPNKAEAVDLKRIDEAVQAIGQRDCPGKTPFQAVKTAYEKLKQVSSNDKNTQYWLIVTTDGSISDIPGSMKGKIQGVLDAYKGEKMANGSKLNVAYLAMEDKYACKEDPKNGLYTFAATDPKEISQALSKISNLISGRFEADPVKQVSDNTVSFRSALPIYSFSVLSQQSAAKVSEVTTGGVQLQVTRNIGLKKDSLFGNAAVVRAGGGQVIAAGEYTVTFSEAVDVKNLLIQYEPAIGVKMEIRTDGVIVDDPSLIPIGDPFTVELIPVIPGTDTVIEPSALPKGLSWQIQYEVDGQVIDSADGAKLSGTTAAAGQNVIRGILRIPGFTELVFEEEFSLTQVIFGLEAQQPEDLRYSRKDPQGEAADRCVRFTVTDDGTPMDPQLLKRLGVKLEVVSVDVDSSMIENQWLRGSNKLNVKLKQNSDGTFSLIPVKTFGCAFFTLAGRYQVTVRINLAPGITADGTFMLVPSWADALDILWLLLVILAVLYVIIVLLRRKFTTHSIEITCFEEDSQGRGEVVSQSVEEVNLLARGNVLLPVLKPCWVETRTCRVRLVAGEGGTVIVNGVSIQRNKSIRAYGTSGYNPERRLKSIRRSLTSVVNEGSEDQERTASDCILSMDDSLYLLNGESVYRFRLLS